MSLMVFIMVINIIEVIKEVKIKELLLNHIKDYFHIKFKVTNQKDNTMNDFYVLMVNMQVKLKASIKLYLRKKKLKNFESNFQMVIALPNIF